MSSEASGSRPPPARIDGAEDLRVAARDLTDVVGSMVSRLTSRRELMPRHFAALGLARCDRLLNAMFVLDDQGLPDAGGACVRPIIETAIVGLYSLLGGQEAFDEIRGAYVRQLEVLPDEEPLASAKSGLVEQWDGPRGQLKIEQLNLRVAEMLHELGGASSQRSAEQLYDIAYRGESMLNVHAGIGSVVGHIEDHGEWLGVSSVRLDSDDGTGQLAVAAVHESLLAYHVFREFGIGTDRIGAIWDQLTSGFSVESVIVEHESTYDV